MIRTQVYLTEREKEDLEELADRTGRSQSELIRAAIDDFLDRSSSERRAERLNEAFGLWKDREDLPDPAKLREEWDRT